MLSEVLKSIIEGKGDGMNNNQDRFNFLAVIHDSFSNTIGHIKEIKTMVKLIGNKYMPETLDDEAKEIIICNSKRANTLLIQATEALLDAYKIIIDKEKKENE